MMYADRDESSKTAAIDFARRLIPHCEEALGTELLGAYLIGSLAHGGFSRRYSDIDMALVTEAGLSSQTAGTNNGVVPHLLGVGVGDVTHDADALCLLVIGATPFARLHGTLSNETAPEKNG
jgi:hypothetical protein